MMMGKKQGGRLPAGFTEVDGIYRTSVGVIMDSGLTWNTDVNRIVAKFVPRRIGTNILYGDSNEGGAYLWMQVKTGGISVHSHYQGNNLPYICESDTMYITEHTFTKFTINGQEFSVNEGTFIPLRAIKILSGQTVQDTSDKLLEIQMYNGETMLADFISARRNSDNQLVFYDIVRNIQITSNNLSTD